MTRTTTTTELSIPLFGYLASQPITVQQRHHTQIGGHRQSRPQISSQRPDTTELPGNPAQPQSDRGVHLYQASRTIYRRNTCRILVASPGRRAQQDTEQPERTPAIAKRTQRFKPVVPRKRIRRAFGTKPAQIRNSPRSFPTHSYEAVAGTLVFFFPARFLRLITGTPQPGCPDKKAIRTTFTYRHHRQQQNGSCRLPNRH